ncbi:MAG: hypothetical protein WCF67_08085 [Chitinophagaceae bacterium]
MRTSLFLSCFLLLASFSFAQNISGIWHGFQVYRDKGEYKEYRITVDLKMSDDSVKGTMQLKSPLKGMITSSLSGTIDKKGNLFLKEDGILTEGVTAEDAKLCSYVLKVKENSLNGKGRSKFKGYDHLKVRLQRKETY